MQLTRQAKKYLNYELKTLQNDITNDIKNELKNTLKNLNEKRKQYGLTPIKTIDKNLVKQTIINLSLDTEPRGDERKPINDNNNFGGMYQ